MYNILESAKTILGNKIELIGEPGENQTLIIGVVHGDEPQGKFLIEEYLKTICKENSPTSKSQISVLPPGEDIAIKQFAQTLRNNMTKEEIILWQHIKQKQVAGIKFRRQQQIYKYICDFVSFDNKIIIELDGSQHIDSLKDKERDRYLTNLGFTILRFWNNDIYNNLAGVLETIKNSKKSLSSPGGRTEICDFEVGETGGKMFIPCLNPDGLEKNTRCNANGVDLNRNFPTKNWGEDTSQAGDNPADYFGGKSPASEIETQFVIDIIKKYKPKLILTLHAPYKIVNYDGPGEDIAQKISNIIKYPVEPSIGYPTPGSFGTWTGVERNIPIITLELDEKIPVKDLLQPAFEIFDLFS